MERTVFDCFALAEAKKCQKAYLFNSYNLNYHGGKPGMRSVLRKALDVVKKAFLYEGKTLEEVQAEVSEVLKEYPLSDDELVIAAEQTLSKAEQKVMRLAEYLWQYKGKGLKNSMDDIRCSCEVDGYVISEKADLILFPEENEVLAVRFDTDICPYSERARKPENRPERSTGVAALCAGLSSLYKEKIVVEEWYLTGKDDKGMELPPFEYRRGKNINRASIDAEEAMEVLRGALSYVNTPHVGDCKECRHASVCRMMSVREDEEKVSGGPKAEPQFTAQQQSVVDHGEGPMAVIAVPGAGKTTVLVHRLKRLLEAGVEPGSILFVTFTKKAAGEIAERVSALVDGELPNIFTFHAFGYTLLKENPTLLGRRVRIAKDIDKKQLLCECLDESPELCGMSYAGSTMEFGIVNRLLGWFDELDEGGRERFCAEHGEKIKDMKGVLSLYAMYTEKLKAGDYVTYDEQISLVCELFRKYPAFLKECGEKYRYIMVDEFQDSDDDQADMIYQLARMHNNIVVVGDDDQNIYGWRGGSNKYLLNFAEDFPGAKVVIMNDNFRSNSQILAASESVISVNSERYVKQIQGHKVAKYAPVFYRDAGAEKIATLIPQLMQTYNAGDIAVIARTNKGCIEVEEVLNGVVKTISPKDYLIEDAVFSIVYDVLTLYQDADISDDVALFRLLCRLGAAADIPKKCKSTERLYDVIQNTEPKFSLDRYSVTAMEEYEQTEKTPLLHAGYVILDVLKKLQYFKSFKEAFKDIADAFHISEGHKVFSLLQEEADERAFVRINEMYQLMTCMKKFRDTVRVGYEPSKDAVNLLTAHDSKGKEFPVVIIYATENFDTSEEGNRLLYVAMTRAKNTLIMLQSPYSAGCKALPVMEEHIQIR